MPYHLRRTDREIGEWPVLEEIIRKGKYATVALCRADEPYLVTLSYGYDAAEHALYFHCAADGQKVDFVRENPNACATVIEDHGYEQGECSHHYRSVVIRGTIEIVSANEDKMRGLDVLIRHLETNPDKVRQRLPQKADRVAKVSIWRMKIASATGKQGK